MRHLTTSAAALIMSATPVFAADLPAPEPIEYVQICDAYGNGYYFIPGTDTCLRIRGRVRAEYRWNNFGDEPNNWTDRRDRSTQTRARGYLRMDARTQTEYGLLRAYIDLFATVDSGRLSQTRETTEFDGADREIVTETSDPTTDMTLDYAFIQFGGMTIGKTHSFYDFWTGYAYGAINTVAYSDVTLWLAGYTFDLGNGLSFSIAAEDQTFRRESVIARDDENNITIGYGGNRTPDLVANLRLDQGWGSAQLMAAVHEVRYAVSYPDSDVGWAVGGGVEVYLPIFTDFMQNTQFALMSSYAQGAMGYVHSDWGVRVFDSVSTENADLTTDDDLTTGWSVAGGLYTEFSDEWNFAIQASYATVNPTRIQDFNQTDAVAKIGWTPVHGFEIGTEIAYRNLDFDLQDGDDDDRFGHDLDGRDIVSVLVRVQRDF
ncbi:porin [Polycladidibacter stylochi]|uniref:porin n=1 Tax=Polycladidibacter stylochi TaxID=1807766 RepID=UPI000835BB25|nr:porin [Pseudovibrio stylochi]